ncbi:hypothetical protein NDU88_008620 [Pleurodeles waltl]|uniref:Uncharacterized protein n=1 Tax=Pleurodeles waltl TaxID=8319 RepID=A0AAV7RV56_PLEWA|nr:hypothetical protein NDU88_008620 [Pleurodeles waltl]
MECTVGRTGSGVVGFGLHANGPVSTGWGATKSLVLLEAPRSVPIGALKCFRQSDEKVITPMGPSVGALEQGCRLVKTPVPTVLGVEQIMP